MSNGETRPECLRSAIRGSWVGQVATSNGPEFEIEAYDHDIIGTFIAGVPAPVTGTRLLSLCNRECKVPDCDFSVDVHTKGPDEGSVEQGHYWGVCLPAANTEIVLSIE